ncbi:hypothetical protein BM1_01127 [Bipolaris maydis]|nr:hypothetical protein BM1_01127 [Bipolaris maydis]
MQKNKDRLFALLRYTWPASQQLREFGLAHAVDSHYMGRGTQSSDESCDSMTNVKLVEIHAHCPYAPYDIQHVSMRVPPFEANNIGENTIQDGDIQEPKALKPNCNAKEASGAEFTSDLPL